MEEKYIQLLLEKCCHFGENKILLIHYRTSMEDFVQKLVGFAKKMGVEEIYLDKEDPYYVHDFLKTSSVQEIKASRYFDKRIWDTYASRHASFLIFETEYPHLMDDIEDEKVALVSKLERESRPLYRKMVEHCELDWCIAAYPNRCWAEELFPGDIDSYEKLKQAIYHICMVDQEDPIHSWEMQLEKNFKVIQYLNQLQLEKLHYSNSLGTSLDLYLPEGYLFSSAKDQHVIVNMPSYEVFASPDFRKTEGIVYASMPLNYSGKLIEDFWIRFERGKVVDYDAKKGKEILKAIMEVDEASCYLGECALVEYDSPISNLGITFQTTLIDENASCHLALGAGFPECIQSGLGCSDEGLIEKGINVSKGHVDFMIGTEDLKIVGVTREGKEVLIFDKGNFEQTFMERCFFIR